ncbi:sporulation protein YqfD [Bacillus sp. DTU_2020_1000418_1_SI_GHA_SEK_038]|uniref:sporulation protein YqfD n=1 Tax=Bacillus sp. DTU_2020_1000418_1_SI_GHA_SEK_038 TaxID=3077585 RepID=UPI0028E37845|nr:sporulation protein YqfD [Bacillus sp. DTU_2020_1000418_1_SI_GHA_SEK_038]WNS74342.1 sporulation protein YqfD [Bacillus sp. DTU_2020_1000418_1_SI_GHA_SEK_038]
MKNLWIEFFGGIITVKTKGKGIERFINTLTRSGILVWQVRRHGTEAVTFKMKLNDVKKLRSLVRNSDCKIEFLQRTGFPFIFKRMLKNIGFVIGAPVFLLVIMILSNMVWGIEIKGADPATEYKIRKELNQIGVKRGKVQFFLENVEAIQRKLTDSIEEITWVGVELKGTTYHLQVVEKTEPNKPEYLSPRHLVAKKKAIIVDMFVEEGQPKVSVNDHVNPGQLLVSGIIGEDGQKTETVPAKGEILGETWYTTKATIPLKNTLQVLNGNEIQKHIIKVGKYEIPIWGFGKVEYKKSKIELNEKKINFLKWELPISYINKTIRESEQVTQIFSNEEAFEVAKIQARNDIKNHLSDNAKIKGEKVLHKSVENGKVTISIHFQIIENIAEAQPIIQGDTE